MEKQNEALQLTICFLIVLGILYVIPVLMWILNKISLFWFRRKSQLLFNYNIKNIQGNLEGIENVLQDIHWSDSYGVYGSVNIKLKEKYSILISIETGQWWLQVFDATGRKETLDEIKAKSFLFENNLKESSIVNVIDKMKTKKNFKAYKFGHVLNCTFSYGDYYEE